MGHALMEKRHGVVVGGGVSQATGSTERDTALKLIDCQDRRRQRIALGCRRNEPDGEETAVGVGQDVAFAAFDLARVLALRPPF
jgi:hypothetical protein